MRLNEATSINETLESAATQLEAVIVSAASAHQIDMEIREAIRLVLQAAGGMTRDELLSEVRHVLGVGKSALTPVFDDVIETMVRDGAVGEGSTGYALRS